MRKLIVLALLLAIAAPALPASRANGSTLTFFWVRPTADAATYRDALLWHYEQHALDGLLATAARPNVALTDLGGGNSELSITMPLAAGNAWVTAYVTGRCSDVSTVALRRACADAAIKQDLRRIWSDYQAFLATPPPEAPEL